MSSREGTEADHICKYCHLCANDGGPLASPAVDPIRSSRKKKRTHKPSSPSGSEDDRNRKDLDITMRKTTTKGDENDSRIEKCREEARISHLKTKRAVKEARQALAESDDLEEEERMSIEERRDNAAAKNLEDIYEIIGKYLKNCQPEPRKKPRILSVEEVDSPFTFRMRDRNDVRNEPSTFWADIAAKLPWKNKITEKSEIQRTPESRINNAREPRQTVGRPALIYDTKEREKQKLRAISQKSGISAAITLQCEADAGYKEMILKAKRKISLTEIDIDDCKIRRGYTGRMVIEIPGEDASDKADT